MLVSPLRRAVQTAALAFERLDVPIEICADAREIVGGKEENTTWGLEELKKELKTLPRGNRVEGVVEAALSGWDHPRPEKVVLEALRDRLRVREEDCVALVCHWGIVELLCKKEGGKEGKKKKTRNVDNAVVVECTRCRLTGELKVAPGGRTVLWTSHSSAPDADINVWWHV